MLIETLDSLREFTTTLMEQAKDNLIADDDLSPVALMYGGQKQIEIDGTMPEELLQHLMRQFVAQDHELELASYITLGDAVETPLPGELRESTSYRVVVVSVSHREFGAMCVSLQVTREAPNQFQFGEAKWSQAVLRSTVLDHLWRPRLNS